ncbi:MAG TPA: tetratricopeptide repeat protein [Myxococcota bacterium]|nr:tetratricopeptide repeat protein [Myxococcota bacterium]HRY95138.1 tetratricopeptide repeat protein [Myxococcota bacterium]
MAINKNKINDAALKFVQKGQLKKAIKEYDKILAEDPADVRTLLKKGDLLVRAGERSDAVETYLQVANAYSQQGFHLKAVAVFKQILKIDESRIDVNLRLAEEYQNLGITGDAMSHLQIMAGYYDQQGMVRESLDILRRMVELDPENVASRIKLAEMYSREQMVAEAVQEFNQAAEFLKNANRIEDYIKVAERLIYHDQSNVVVMKELAGIYLQRGDTKRALGKLQVCFKAEPRDLDTLSMLAMAFQELNQLSKTISVYKEMAKIYQDMGAVEEMQQTYRRVLEVSPDDPEARQALGLESGAPAQAVELDGGLPAEPATVAELELPAEADLDLPAEPEMEAVEVSALTAPTAPGAEPQGQAGAEAGHLSEAERETISRLLTETDVYIKYGLTNKAYEHLQRVFERDPNNVEAHEKLKDLYVAAGQMDHAAQELATLAHLNMRRGRTDAARNHLRALLSIAPNHPIGLQLVAQLDAQAPLAEVGSEAGGGEFAVVEPGASDVLVSDDGGAVQVGEEPESIDVAIDAEIDIDLPPGIEEDSGQFEAVQPEPGAEAVPEVVVLEDGAGQAAEAQDALPDFDDLDDELEVGLDPAAGDLDPALVEELDADPAASPEAGAVELSDASPEDLALIASVDDVEEEEEEGELPTRVASMSELDAASLRSLSPAPVAPAEPAAIDVPSLLEEPASTLDDYQVGDETMEAEALRGDPATQVPPASAEPELLPFEEEEQENEFFRGEPAATPVAGHDELEPEDMSEEPEVAEAQLDAGAGQAEAGDAPGPGLEANLEADLEELPSASADDVDLLDAGEAAEVDPPSTELEMTVPGAGASEAAPLSSLEEEITGPMGSSHRAPAPPVESEEVGDPLADSLEEIDFFLEQNLIDEARDGLAALRAEHPGHAGVLERQAKLDRLLAGESQAPAVSPEELSDGFDLAQAISDEVGGDTFSAPMTDEFQYSVDDVLSEFKKGVAKVVAKEDSATHFDLGIAYKEMGLIDDAIGEFSLAAQDAHKQVEALSMVGLCLSEKGQYSDAINRFKDALHTPGLDEEKATGLYYEMGLVYELLHESGEALYYFKKVFKRDPKFRDVAQRLKTLVKGAGAAGGKATGGNGAEGTEDAAEDAAGPGQGTPSAGKKDKISYM